MSPWLVAFLICLVAVIAEGLLAGRNVRQHFREIQLPRASPPMWLWIAIGLAYYVICYSILVRSLSGGHNVAVGLLVLILAANAFWNYLFFRARNYFACLVFSIGYGVLAVALLLLLANLDRSSALVLLPYVAYLAYAGRLQYSIWRLNTSRRS